MGSLTSSDNVFNLRVVTFHPLGAHSSWKLLFTTCSNRYESSISSIRQDLYSVDCDRE